MSKPHVLLGMWFPTQGDRWIAMEAITSTRERVKPEYALQGGNDKTWLNEEFVMILSGDDYSPEGSAKRHRQMANTARRRATTVVETLDPVYASLVSFGLVYSPDELRSGSVLNNVFLRHDVDHAAIEEVAAYTTKTTTGIYASINGGYSPKNYRARHPDADEVVTRAVLGAVKRARTQAYSTLWRAYSPQEPL